MERRTCAPGSEWDSLLKHCISQKSLGLRSSPITESPVPVLKPVLGTGGPAEWWPALSPSVWICVGLVVSCSLLVLLFWFIIYRQQSRGSQDPGDKVRQPAASPRQEEEVPCLHPNSQIGDRACGRGSCNGWAEHGLPLPATELGDSALVTTKTGQVVDV